MIELDPNQVLGLDLEISGARLRIRCACAEEFDSMQTTLGGLALAVHICPACRAELHSGPQTSLAVIARFVPDHSYDELLEINREVTELALNWHGRGPWPRLFDCQGVTLGPPMERELQAHLLAPLFLDPRGGQS